MSIITHNPETQNMQMLGDDDNLDDDTLNILDKSSRGINGFHADELGW